MMNFIAVDFETATPKNPCSVGMVKVINGEIVDEYYTLLRPEPYEMNFFHKRVHGIGLAECAEAPTFGEFWDTIGRHWIHGSIIVAHNIIAERSVFQTVFAQYNIENQGGITDYLCSMELACIHGSLGRYKGDTYYKQVKLEIAYQHYFGKTLQIAHDALFDARAAAEIVIHIVNKWKPPHFAKFPKALQEGKYAPTYMLTDDDNKEMRKSECKMEIDVLAGIKEDALFKGQHILVTGDIRGMTRQRAKDILSKMGAISLSTSKITSKTSFVIMGEYEKQFAEKEHRIKGEIASYLETKGQKITLLTAQDFLSYLNEEGVVKIPMPQR
jgi:DNA polymerase-3 subunit epsilon